MAKLERVTPFVPVTNLNTSLEFFRDILGFEVRLHSEGYAFIIRDNAALRLIEVGNGRDLHDPKSQQHIYIDVSDVDELYDALKDGLEKLPQGRLRKPFDTAYGQREFHVTDEDALLISFGSELKS